MKKHTRFFSALLVFALLLTAVGCQSSSSAAPAASAAPSTPASASAAPAPAPAPAVAWSLGTSSSGSNPNNLGVCIAKVINEKQSAVTLSAQVTAGYKENTVLISSGDIQIGMGNAYDISLAYNQQESYAGMEELKDLRRMFGFTPTYSHLIVRADSDIYSISDLKGKRYNMNTPSSTTYPQAQAILQCAGLDVGDVQVFEIATGSSLDGLRDKLFDATFNTYAIGASSLLELSSTVPIRLIPIKADEFERLNEIRKGTLTYTKVPANTYKGQTEDTPCYVHYNILYANKDADEEVVYQVTKAFWENLAELQALNPGFDGLDIKNADAGPSDVPMHPGAERYLKEAGVL